MQTSLRGINNKAKNDSRHRFGGIYRLLNEANLRWSFYQLNKRASVGVDNCDWDSYETDLDENLQNLVLRLKRKSYKTKLIRRHYIPKANGKQRPLGIPSLEDKIVQYAASKILESIYEADFKGFSYGYRPVLGCHDAVRQVCTEARDKPHNWVVEADIKGFFDNLDHGWLLKMLEHRIDDRAFIKLIGKWLKAGILDDGEVIRPESGTPQGGIISPVLANIYLHYVLDLWFDHRVRKQSVGNIGIVRYADDFVCFFQKKADAELFYEMLPDRLAKFNLSVASEKTNLLRFTKLNPEQSESFEFLGFEFRWQSGCNSKSYLQKKTSAKKQRKSIADFKLWIKNMRNLKKVSELMRIAASKMRGHYNYFGIKGNYERLGQYYYYCIHALYKWLNRRSQKRSYNWTDFKVVLQNSRIPKPRVKHFV
ncbi:MAG: group II intron reverse transcriptase/maturase [Pseudomonadales bacterium]|nr:group II intron reverse transcriptase/maturase [Pseudomonadales bacterium]